MTRDELVTRLAEIRQDLEHNRRIDASKSMAFNALIAYVNDDEITEAYLEIKNWHL